MDEILQNIFNAILEGDNEAAPELVQAAIDDDFDSSMVLNEAMIPAMEEVGSLFEEGEYFVPEMLISARAMQAGLAVLRPYLLEADVQPAGTVVIGTVKGDLHDIGKNLVCMMLEGGGFEIIDLGADVTPEAFIKAIEDHKPDIIGMSALLTTTMPSMRTTIDALTDAGLRERVKIMVGGAPVTQDYADQVGADGYAT
ncbi:MAG: corrinoid protein, partial [Chloroflexota bacterium]|nr:corrinoid protein [Chloroflexota bacterium]